MVAGGRRATSLTRRSPHLVCKIYRLTNRSLECATHAHTREPMILLLRFGFHSSSTRQSTRPRKHPQHTEKLIQVSECTTRASPRKGRNSLCWMFNAAISGRDKVRRKRAPKGNREVSAVRAISHEPSRCANTAKRREFQSSPLLSCFPLPERGCARYIPFLEFIRPRIKSIHGIPSLIFL